MASSSDHSALVGFLIGIVVLVFVGIGFSLAVDRRLGFSSGRASLEREIATRGEHLEGLRHRVALKKEQLEGRGLFHAEEPGQIGELTSLLRTQEQSIHQWTDRRDALTGEIASADEALTTHRSRYRQQVRAAAVGEEVEELKSRSGKIYNHVVIQQVTAAGLTVRHDRGLSRIAMSDLGPEWIERFQWEAAELKSASPAEGPTRQEAAPAASATVLPKQGKRSPEPAAVAPSTRTEKTAAAADREARLTVLRSNVMTLRSKLQETESQAVEARNQAAANRGRSVPRSLETWDQRAARLDGVASQLRKQHIEAMAQLGALAPGDPLARF